MGQKKDICLEWTAVSGTFGPLPIMSFLKYKHKSTDLLTSEHKARQT